MHYLNQHITPKYVFEQRLRGEAVDYIGDESLSIRFEDINGLVETGVISFPMWDKRRYRLPHANVLQPFRYYEHNGTTHTRSWSYKRDWVITLQKEPTLLKIQRNVRAWTRILCRS